MRKYIIYIFLILAGSLTLINPKDLSASMLSACEIEAELLEILSISESNIKALVKVLEVKQSPSCYQSDKFKKDIQSEIMIYLKDAKSRKYNKNDLLKLKYETYNGMGPNGVVETESWSLSD